MRCFISINLDDVLKREIGSVARGLTSGRWDVKWVSLQNLHITLKFLGNAPDDSIDRIKERLAAVAKGHASFGVRLAGVGVFPDRRRPRVVWIGLINSGELIELQKEVEDSMVTAGFEKEDRAFSPHLTIGRIRSLVAREPFIAAIETLKERDFGNIRVDKICLMKSDLKPTGAQYSIVAEFPLIDKEAQ